MNSSLWFASNSRETRLQFKFVMLQFLGIIATLCAKSGSTNLDSFRTSNANHTRIALSTPEQCRRTCQDNETPRYCYYYLTLEHYTTMNSACSLCQPGDTNTLSDVPECECIEADGFERTLFSINRMLPGPSIQVCLGDRLIIDVENNIEGVGVSLHWHGLFQKGFQHYDGVPYITQCPIHFRNIFRYQFIAGNAGTHFYHSHVAVHKIDGQYGSLVVRAPPSLEPHSGLYDEDLPTHVIILSDWMHEMSVERYPGLLHRLQGQAATNALINGKGSWTDPLTNRKTNVSLQVFEVEPNKRYRFRMINAFSTVCLAQFSIQHHRMRIIAQDGENVVPRWVDTIITGSGERVDFIIHTTRHDHPETSYWIQLRGLSECEATKVNQLAILRYKGTSLTRPLTPEPTYSHGLPQGSIYNPLDARCDFKLGDEDHQRQPQHVCPNQLKSLTRLERELLVPEADYRFVFPFRFYSYRHKQERLFKPGSYNQFLSKYYFAFTVDNCEIEEQTKINGTRPTASPSQDLLLSLIDDIAWKTPSSPPIIEGSSHENMCDSREKPANCTEPCVCTHTLRVRKDSIVEIILYDQNLQAKIAHPFHLHGYTFRVLSMGRFEKNLNITREDMEFVINQHNDRLRSGFYDTAPAKDTIIVPEGGWVILRFKADNPGWWFFHCHFVWHSANGMNVVFNVGEPNDLPPMPPGFPTCGNFQPLDFPSINN